MNKIFENLYKLAKSTRYQNLFTASKEIHGIRLFRNSRDFSNLQNIFLSSLYNFNAINQAISIDKINRLVLENQIYWEAYLLYKQKNTLKQEKIDIKKELQLTPGRLIKFPGKKVN